MIRRTITAVLLFGLVAAAAYFSDIFTPQTFQNITSLSAEASLLLGATFLSLILLVDLLVLGGRNSGASNELEQPESKELGELRNERDKLASQLRSLQQQSKLAPKSELIDASVLQFLSSLQEKGRLLDFAMEDITQQPDERIGAVARVVHQGVKEVLEKSFAIRPLNQSSEGESIELESNYNSEQFRFVGKVESGAAIKGKIVHRGWITDQIKLPQVTEAANTKVIQPTVVEVK